ncbi:MAG: tetratricopeptide repeat protein [Rubrivivax sp.]|nr:tetratricopeptide repeat protein [Rubrivivax sp.]MDP3083654.1 tetratricopeptide repeat protein [Rubrivivax sp.]
MKRNLLLVALAGLSAISAPLHGADTPEPAPARVVDPLAAARAHVAAKRWQPAVAELQRVNASNSADWNNLMGYALRKRATPDLDGAQRHYDAALRIDPLHRGALEYAGELALMKGELAVAEERLARLARICSTPCEELDDLRKAVERYKAAGNRYRP